MDKDCMKMKVKDIKKSKAYKDLKRKGKSKLRKKELCKLFDKKVSIKKRTPPLPSTQPLPPTQPLPSTPRRKTPMNLEKLKSEIKAEVRAEYMKEINDLKLVISKNNKFIKESFGNMRVVWKMFLDQQGVEYDE